MSQNTATSIASLSFIPNINIGSVTGRLRCANRPQSIIYKNTYKKGVYPKPASLPPSQKYTQPLARSQHSTMSFSSEPDVQLGKIVKKTRVNPEGENIYLREDHSLIVEMDMIKKVQRTFREKYYRPGGAGCQKVLAKYAAPKPSVNRKGLIDAMQLNVNRGRQAFSTDVALAGKYLETVKFLSETLHLVTNFEAMILSSNVDID